MINIFQVYYYKGGIYVGYMWDICGIYVGYIWDIYGIYMGYIWDISDLFTFILLRSDGLIRK